MRGSLSLSRAAALSAVLALAAGCAAAPATLAAPSRPIGAHRGRHIVGAAQLDVLGASSAYDAIRLARVHLGIGADVLEPRQGVRIYVDGLPVFSASALRRMPASWIADVEYLPPAEATQWLGAGHPSGAILIATWATARR